MRNAFWSLGLVTLLSTTSGCTPESSPDDIDPEGEDTAVAASPQVDPQVKTYAIHQSGVLVASAWAGPRGDGTVVEYWATKSGYQGGATRTFSGASESCAAWKSTVCGTAWAAPTYYQATYTQQALNCTYPPGPTVPPAGAVSFLSSGSYRTSDAGGSQFGWTYVSGNVEYWAMHHTITNGTSTQVALRPTSGYSSLGDLVTKMCAMSPVPATFYSAYYTPVSNFCATNPC